jgi:Bacterial regulatory proteins, tetR family
VGERRRRAVAACPDVRALRERTPTERQWAYARERSLVNACSGARCLSDAPGRCGIGSATTRPAGLRELLIVTAEKLLAERQVSTITTGDIARTAGVSDGVLYTYLADKNDLLVAALVRRYAAELERFDG